MRRPRFAVWFVCLAMVLTTVVAVAAARPSTAAASAKIVLKVTGPNGAVRKYTMKQLKQFTAYKGYAGYVKTGKVGMQKPHPVKGVRLLDVLKKVGYKSGSVTIAAKDGYKLTYSSDKVHGKKVTMYKAKAPKYPKVTIPKTNPLTAILAYQDKKIGARVNDSNPWRNYKADGSDEIGPLRFWWAYKKWAKPGYVQIGSSSMRMVKSVKAN